MKASHSTIRPACVEDVSAIATLLRNVFTWAYGQVIPPDQLAVFLEEAFADTIIAQDLEQPEVLLYVAELAANIVGVARLAPNLPVHDTTLLYAIELTKCYILPEYHGQGIADALLCEMYRVAIESGWQHMWLYVWQENPRAVAFYQKHGFVVVDTADIWVGEICFKDYVMLRALSVGAI